jgi:hypothetical protein
VETCLSAEGNAANRPQRALLLERLIMGNVLRVALATAELATLLIVLDFPRYL